MDIAQFVTVVTQLGFAAAAWRLATTIDQRLKVHEALDLKFHTDTQAHLVRQDQEFKAHRDAGQQFQAELRAGLGLAR